MHSVSDVSSRIRPRSLTRLSFLLLALVAACADNPLGSVPVASVQVAPATVALQTQESRQLSASLYDASGSTLQGRAVAWSSDDENVATVSGAGLVTARGAGSARITATSEGRSGHANITVAAPPAQVASVVLDVTTARIDEGDVLQITATPRDAQQNPIAGLGIQWRTSDETVAQISASGRVTGVRAGTATITARVHDREAAATVVVSTNYDYDLIFAETGQSSSELYRLDMRSGGEPTRLLPAGTQVFGAKPSPDGTKLVMTAVIQDVPGIYVVNRDGTGLRTVITNYLSTVGEPTWSPDGRLIAFTRRFDGGAPQIWVRDAAGEEEPVNLTAELGDGQHFGPAWSPRFGDGSSRIAFVRQVDGGVSRIWTMRPDGSDKREVTTSNFLDSQPAWSPDGATIVFERIGNFGADLRLVDGSGGNDRPLLLAGPSGRKLTPAWSPDGRLIAFTAQHESQGSFTSQVYTLWADGSKLARRTSGGANKRNPAWLPRP